MPSSYPFPSIASIALSLYTSGKRIENLPTIRTYQPSELVWIARACIGYVSFPGRYEEI